MSEGTARLMVRGIKPTQVDPSRVDVMVPENPVQVAFCSRQQPLLSKIAAQSREPTGSVSTIGCCSTQIAMTAKRSIVVLHGDEPGPCAPSGIESDLFPCGRVPAHQTVDYLSRVEGRRFRRI